AGAGYGLPAAKDLVAVSYATDTAGSKVTAIQGSFGKGMQAGLYAGYMIGEKIGFEAGFSYLMSSKYNSTQQFEDGTGDSDKDEITAYGKMMRVYPALRFTIGEDATKGYLRTGISFGFGAKMTSETKSTSVSSSITTNSERTHEYSGGLSIGYMAGAGFTHMFSDQVGIFAEVGFNFQNWSPQERNVTKYTVDGTDQLAGMTVSQKTTEYNKEVTFDNSTFDPNKPSQQLQFHLPFSSWGINAGVHFSFGGK
ncbi:MAG TPA: hypothetical protein VI731_02840, partial [Bacteroidia bacterium]|nr:hypothetical protein [Bacteroidia bacterium]